MFLLFFGLKDPIQVVLLCQTMASKLSIFSFGIAILFIVLNVSVLTTGINFKEDTTLTKLQGAALQKVSTADFQKRSCANG